MPPFAKVCRIALFFLFASILSSQGTAQSARSALPLEGTLDAAFGSRAHTQPNVPARAPDAACEGGDAAMRTGAPVSIRPQLAPAKAAADPPLIMLTIPDDLTVVHGRTFSIPIRFRTFDVLRVESFSFGLRFDRRSIEILRVSPTADALADGFTFDVRNTADGAEISASGGAFSDSSGTLLELIARAWIPAGMDRSFEVVQRQLGFTGLADFGPDVRVMFIDGGVTISGDCVEPLKVYFSMRPFAPNPFNASTTAEMYVFREGAGRHLLLEVLDMRGRRVALLFDGALTAGVHTFRFDAGYLPSGSYVARLSDGPWYQSSIIHLVK
jgi:hypothetical protein